MNLIRSVKIYEMQRNNTMTLCALINEPHRWTRIWGRLKIRQWVCSQVYMVVHPLLHPSFDWRYNLWTSESIKIASNPTLCIQILISVIHLHRNRTWYKLVSGVISPLDLLSVTDISSQNLITNFNSVW